MGRNLKTMHSRRETLAKNACSRVLCDFCSRGKVSESKDNNQGSSSNLSPICTAVCRTTPVSDLGSHMSQQLNLLLILRHRSTTHQRSTTSLDTPLLPLTTHASNPITYLRIPSLILILNLSITLMNNTFLSLRYPTRVLRRYTR